MPKKKKLVAENHTTEDAAKYLQQLSQCAYNIKTIIDIHSKKTLGYDKELGRFYRLDKEKLQNILTASAGAFEFDQMALADDLISNDYDTPEITEKIGLAKRGIMSLLDKVQMEREKVVPRYRAKTGLENGDLKDYILSLIDSGQKEYPKKLLGPNENFIIKERGEYKYDGRQIIFNDKNSLYYHVFDIIFSKSDPIYTISYDEINNQLQRRGLNKKQYESKNIQNVFTNTIWRTVLLIDGSKIENKNGSGDPIVGFKRGIIINNTY